VTGTALGVGAALAASACYAVAVATQAHQARGVAQHHRLRLSLLDRLARRPLWVAGMLMGLLAWLLQGLALTFAPLTIVEPMLATTLVFLLLIGWRALGETIGAREVFAAIAVGGGLAALCLAAPGHTERHVRGTPMVIALIALSAAATAPYILRRRSSGIAMSVGAGVSYAGVALTTKFASDELSSGHPRAAAAWLVILACFGLTGLLSEMSALQSQQVTRVAPIVFGLNIMLPVALAPGLAGETWQRTGGGQIAVPLALAAIAAGVVALAQSPSLRTTLTAGPHRDAT
jgi:drug/metabolite transporter (DMT)-like permease